MADVAKKIKSRYRIFYGALLAFLIIVCAQLVNLQITQGEALSQEADATLIKKTTVTGKRGSILDKNGTVLATDKECYNVTFYCEPGDNKAAARKAYTQSILNAIDIIESSGGKVPDEFSLRQNADGQWMFDFGTQNESTHAAREKLWRENFYLTDEKHTIDTLFDTLCQRYQIPEDADYALKRKALSVWQSMQMRAFLGVPVTIAADVSFEVVAKIAARQADNVGIDVTSAYKRVYPMDDVAAHIVGYTGKIQSEKDLEYYRGLGYSQDVSVGITGVERSMEETLSQYLTERQGYQITERNSVGKIAKINEYKAPKDGNSIVLTIDLEFQQMLEKALPERIAEINENQRALYEANKQEYDELVAARGGAQLAFAQTGAAVVMNVHTGDILAMASYPSFSLNAFSGGISSADYAALEADPRKPLFNRVVSSRETPGSIFKMATALAALQEGVITPTERIDDAGRYTKYDQLNGPRCWQKDYSKHSNQTVKEAIQNSCNYFFYEMADRLGIDRLKSWADMLGLTSKTNIQITGESTSVVGDQNTLYDPDISLEEQAVATSRIVYADIKDLLKKVGEELGRDYDDDRLNRVSKQLMDLAPQYSYTEAQSHIREILISETGLGLTSAAISQRSLVNRISEHLAKLRWTPTQTIMTGIGQAITQVTPIAVARYVAAIANGGTVYDANVVDRVLDSAGNVVSVTEPTVLNELHDVESSLSIIRAGMHGVTDQEAGGTAAKYFADYEYTYQLGAKTGTAQVSKIDLENHAWFVVFAPFDEPEIALVVFIPNGYSGSSLSLIVQDIITYYIERQATLADEGMYTPGQLLP